MPAPSRARWAGNAGGAAGTVAGVLFLDQNDAGRRSASDPGAPNVTIILDGLYSARTDAQGRFEFPLVAAGGQRLVSAHISYAGMQSGRICGRFG